VVDQQLPEIPDFVIAALMRSDYSRGDAKYSPSNLSSPPQIRVLMQRHPHALPRDPWKRIHSVAGSAFHAWVIDPLPRDRYLVEERQYATVQVDGREVAVSGQLDVFDLHDATLYDIKTTSTWSHAEGPKPEWTWQTNVYAWMLRQQGLRVERIRVLAFYLRDWSESRIGHEDYPPIPCWPWEIPILPDGEVVAWLQDRIARHEWAETRPDAELPPCTPDERWMTADDWVVQKRDSDRPWKHFATQAEAEAFHGNMRPVTAQQYEVRHIPPTPKRCQQWCPVASVCHQYQRELGGAEGQGCS